MPEHNVVLTARTGIEYYRIYRQGDDHSQVIMTNSLKKDENGDPVTDEDGVVICQNFYGQVVKFVVDVELGYDLELSITGDRSGTGIKWFELDNDPDSGDVWAFYMPAEPVTIRSATSEKTIYEGKPFVGEYDGFFINTTRAGSLYRAASPTMSMTLKSNTVFLVRTTDENGYDFKGTYTFDEQKNTFDYVYETVDEYGLSGDYSEEITLAVIADIKENMPENSRFYVVSKSAISDYTAASNGGGTVNLLEFETASGTVHYLFERANYSLKKVDVRFLEGSAIGDDRVTAIVSEAGNPLIKYTVEEGKPLFSNKGREAGSYTGANGELKLDGFGSGTLGSREGTYTVEGSIVTLTIDGAEAVYVIDMNARTYTAVGGDGAWDGPDHFATTGDFGYWNGTRRALVSVTLDGETANFRAIVENDYGEMGESVTSDAVKYVYDPDTGTLTLSQVTQGKADGGWGSERADIVLKVSDDKRTLTFTQDRIYSIGTPARYIVTTGLSMQAE